MFRENIDAYQGNTFYFVKPDGPEVIRTQDWLNRLIQFLPTSTPENKQVSMYNVKKIDTWTSGAVAMRTSVPWSSDMAEQPSLERWRTNFERTRNLTSRSWLHGVAAAVESGRVGGVPVERPPFRDEPRPGDIVLELKVRPVPMAAKAAGASEVADPAESESDDSTDGESSSDDEASEEDASLDWKYVDVAGAEGASDDSSVYEGRPGPVPPASRSLRPRRLADWRQRYESSLVR